MNTAGGAGASITSGCNVKCAGDSTKNCGGGYTMEVFQKITTTAKVVTTSAKITTTKA